MVYLGRLSGMEVAAKVRPAGCPLLRYKPARHSIDTHLAANEVHGIAEISTCQLASAAQPKRWLPISAPFEACRSLSWTPAQTRCACGARPLRCVIALMTTLCRCMAWA